MEEKKAIQPIDTWVKRIVGTLVPKTSDKSIDRIRERIVKECKKRDLSIIRFNQGAWYVGSKPFEPVLSRLIKGVGISDSRELEVSLTILEFIRSIEKNRIEREWLSKCIREIHDYSTFSISNMPQFVA